MKGIRILFAISWTLIVLGAIAVFGLSGNNKDEKTLSEVEKTAQECEIPAFAKVIGHEDKWLLHNGCPPTNIEQKNDGQ